MNKLWLIIQREYLTRVKKRSFILATILTPFAFVLFFIIVGFIFSYEGDDKLNVAIVDENNILDKKPSDEENLFFTMENKSFEDLVANIEASKYDVIIKVPNVKNLKTQKFSAYYQSKNQLGLDVHSKIGDKLSERIREYKMREMKLDKEQLESLRSKVSLVKENDEGQSTFTSIIGAGIGGVMGFIMYITVFIYGMMVMRSVMEEKTSRIVEVMISSVKPFQLMMGKIIGVGAVGLTQMIIWSILIPIGYFLVALIFNFDTEQMNAVAGAGAGAEIDVEEVQGMAVQIATEIGNKNWWSILPLFLFYFLGGYFLYASLFAAVGSAMGDDMGEGQALTIPITIPVILALYIMMVVVTAPQSNLAIWSSIFPLFSPIVMPARLVFEPPLWQIAVSMIVLAATSVFFVWLSARIYRVGILMYGKKVGFKEIGRWLFYRD
jgi:ABC-2 type transport system permease protein